MGAGIIHFLEPSWYSEATHMITRPLTRRYRKQLLEEKIELASYGNDWEEVK